MSFTTSWSKALENVENQLPPERTRRNEPLSEHTYIKLGGPAVLFTVAQSADELAVAIQAADEAEIPRLILGGGSNVLIGDEGYRGLVIKNEARGVTVQGSKVTAESGVLLNTLVSNLNERGLGGLEAFISVPGTVGGAVYNNSHYRPERGEFIGNALYSAEVIVAGKRERVDRAWFAFAYDHSRLQELRGALLTATFQLTHEPPADLKARSLSTLKTRNLHQPIGSQSCGCMFRNPESKPAGKLIDMAGLKGRSVGGASISTKHANFIINDGTATVVNVLELLSLVKTEVSKSSGIELRPEVFLVGSFSSVPENLKPYVKVNY